jgi:hypothetical protein
VSDFVVRWFRFLCKFGFPAILLVLVGLMVSDGLDRWPIAAAALSKYPDQNAILIGSGYHSRGDSWTRSANYLLFPSLKSVEITASSMAPPQLEESTYGMVGLVWTLFWLVLICVLCIWQWRRPTVTAPPNNRWRGP